MKNKKMSKPAQICYDTFVSYNIIMQRGSEENKKTAASIVWQRYKEKNSERIWQADDTMLFDRYQYETQKGLEKTDCNIFEVLAAILYIELAVTPQTKRVYKKTMKLLYEMTKAKGYNYKDMYRKHMKNAKGIRK